MSDTSALNLLIDRVRAARADRGLLAICGAGTKDFYGEAIQGERLELRPLTGITSYEPSELVVTVRAGTPLAELEALLAEKGQCLPFEPPRYRANDASTSGAEGGAPAADAATDLHSGLVSNPVGGTVGGMVAAGLAGPARAAVGGVRDYVLGATLLNGRAEVLSFGGTVMKNVAGYDVSRLLAGSMGMLGVIMQVSLKVLPMAPATATLRFEMDEAAALRQLNAWGALPLPINASAWWSGMLVLRLSGAAAAVQAAVARLGGEVVEAPLAAAFWAGLRDQTDEFFVGAIKALGSGATLWRLGVPQTAAPLQLPGEHLVEWGGAQRWVVTSAAPALLREAAARVGGHATVFRAGAAHDGAASSTTNGTASGTTSGTTSGAPAALPRFAALSPPLARIHRELKTAFDPEGIFNRGRLYRDL